MIDDSLHYGDLEEKNKEENSLQVLEDQEDVASVISSLEEEMLEAARKMEFEKAALIRDQIAILKKEQPKGKKKKAHYKKRRK
jgi:excinuclease ABC subunit B